MMNKEAKEWLSRAFEIEGSLDELEERRVSLAKTRGRLTNILESSTAVICDKKLAEITEDIVSQIFEQTKARSEIIAVINDVKGTDPIKTSKLKNVLLYRYVDLLEWDDISRIMQYEIDSKYVYNLHAEALMAVAEVLKEKRIVN